MPQVLDPGDFAVRGGLLDVFPMGSEQPFRVELLDDEIDTVRMFDPETQRSLERIESVELLPGRELPLDEDSLRRVMQKLRDRFDVDTRRSANKLNRLPHDWHSTSANGASATTSIGL